MWPLSSEECYVSIDIEADGPAPGLNSMLSLGAAAFTSDGALAQTFSVNLEPLRSSLANGLPRCGGLVLHRRTGASADRCNAGDISTPAPHKPALSRGETRGSQVPGPSSSCVPCSTTPPGATAPRPSLGAVAVAFRLSNTLGTLESRFLSWLHGSRPTRSRSAGPSSGPCA